MKKETRLLAFILFLSIVLRSIGLERRGIWYDDAFSVILAGLPIDRMIAGTAADTMPPLYYLLLHAWMQISTSIGFLRLPGLFFSTVAVALLYGIVARLINPRAGLWAAFLAAISPFQIYYAQELRSYALLECAQLGYLLFFVRLWHGGSASDWRDWTGLVLCGAAAMYSHNLAVFGLAAPSVFLLLRREWKLLMRITAAQAVIGLLALPWMINLPGQIAHIQGGWSIPAPGFVELLQAFLVFTSNLPLEGIWLGAGLLVGLWALALLLFEVVRGRQWPGGMGLLAATALTAPLLMLATSYILRPVFVPRGFLIAALAYDGLAGAVIACSWPRSGVLVSLFVAGMFIALPGQIAFNQFPRSPHHAVADYLVRGVAESDVILHDNKLSYFPVRVYAPQLTQGFLPDEPGGHNDTFSPGTQAAMQIFPQTDLPSAVNGAQRVYFVVYTQAINEYAAMGLAKHPALAWLEQNFQLAGQLAFGDLEIYRFEQ